VDYKPDDTVQPIIGVHCTRVELILLYDAHTTRAGNSYVTGWRVIMTTATIAIFSTADHVEYTP